MASDGFKQLVRWKGNAKIVTFEDTRLAGAVERFLEEQPQRIVLANYDAPLGTYEVESRSIPGGCWEVRLDPERGVHVGMHSCPYRAENPKDYGYPCIHIAGAWLKWRADRDANSPMTQRLKEMESMTEEHTTQPGTALVPATREPETGLAYYVPSKEHIGNSLSLAKVLFETRGAAIPSNIKTVQEAAAIILAGEALGMDPMTAFRRIFTVNGRTQPDSQTMAALIQTGGGDLIYHEASDDAADVELIRPGRPPVRVRYTMQQAKKAGLVKSQQKDIWENGKKTGEKRETSPWMLFPSDMLVWKAVARCARRGAADLINRIGVAMVEVDHFEDASRQMGGTYTEEPQPERQALQDIDRETGEIHEGEFTHEEEQLSSSEAESESAPVGTKSDDTISETPQTESELPGTMAQPEPVGPASSATAKPTSASNTQEKSPPEGEVGDTQSPTGPKSLTYHEAMADKKAHFEILTAFQKAVRGKTLPPDPASWTLDALVHHVGAEWPRD